MNNILGLAFAGGVLWACWRFFRWIRHNDPFSYSIALSEPPVEPSEMAHKLPAHLLEGCPPDPCPEVLYEHLSPANEVTYAQLQRPGKRLFARDCCGGPRVEHMNTLVCNRCDQLGYPEDQ